MLYGTLGVDCHSSSESLYPSMKVSLRIVRARPIFYKTSDNPIISLGESDGSLQIRSFSLQYEYHKKELDMLVYIPVVFNYLETLGTSFIYSAR